jgi:hypothetical protein
MLLAAATIRIIIFPIIQPTRVNKLPKNCGRKQILLLTYKNCSSHYPEQENFKKGNRGRTDEDVMII